MKKSNTYTLSFPANYLKVLSCAFLLLFAGNIILTDILPYLPFDKEVYGRFWDVRWWLTGHAAGVLLALIIGPFQFWEAFRNHYITVHQTLGKVYVIAILIGVTSCTYLAWTTAAAIHWTWAVAMQVGAFLWVSTILMAVRAIMQRRIQSHKEWMIRSYVMTFAFIGFRWLMDLPLIANAGSFTERAPTVAWFVFTIPLFFTEIILQWNND